MFLQSFIQIAIEVQRKTLLLIFEHFSPLSYLFITGLHTTVYSKSDTPIHREKRVFTERYEYSV